MDTLLAILTPPGKSAIATIAVRGPMAYAAARTLFEPHSGTLPDAPNPGRFRLGKLGGDDVVLTIKEGEIEVHCHGGVEVVRLITEQFTQNGVCVVPWQQYVGADAPLRELLANAPTTRTAAILLDQWQGAWDTRDHDATGLQRLQALIPLGQHLVAPWKVVIAGAPNVGKSSLINALAGYTRSVVSPIPGTTRDVVKLRAAIDGWPVELTDTAGIRIGESELEQEGIARAHSAADAADLRIWLLDGSTPPVLPETGHSWLYAINKCDLSAAWNWEEMAGAVPISARLGAGIAELCELISGILVPSPPRPGEAVPCLPAHIDWVRSAYERKRPE